MKGSAEGFNCQNPSTDHRNQRLSYSSEDCRPCGRARSFLFIQRSLESPSSQVPELPTGHPGREENDFDRHRPIQLRIFDTIDDPNPTAT